jgi:hypothetical protein
MLQAISHTYLNEDILGRKKPNEELVFVTSLFQVYHLYLFGFYMGTNKHRNTPTLP